MLYTRFASCLNKTIYSQVYKITAYEYCWIVIKYQFNYTKKTMNMGPTKIIKMFIFVVIAILISVENSNANGKNDLYI